MNLERNKLDKTLLALCVGSALGAGSAHALEWSQTPTVSVTSGTDSNIHLSVNDEREVTSSRLDVSTNVTGRAERLQWAIRPRAQAIDYSDDRELDRRDAELDTSLDVGSESHRWTLAASYGRDGTLTSAFEESGFTEVDADRDRARYTVGWSGLTGERGTASFSLLSQSVSYEDIPGAPLVDYDYAGASFTYSHRLSDRANFEFRLFASQLDTEVVLSETDNSGLSIAFAGNLSESLEYRIGAGRYRSSYPGALGSENTDTSIDASLAKRWNRWRVTTTLSAAIEPSAYAVFYRREAMSVDINHRFAESIDASLRLTGAQIQSDQPLLWFEDRRYSYAQMNLNWRFAERLSLSFSIGTRGQEYFERPRARSAYGQIGLTYRGRGS